MPSTIEASSELMNELQRKIGTKMCVILKWSSITIYSGSIHIIFCRIRLHSIYSYDPGDVAVIHPYASADEVDTFLKLQDWDDIADDAFDIKRNMTGAPFYPSQRAVLMGSRPIIARPLANYNNSQNPLQAFLGSQRRSTSLFFRIHKAFHF